MHGKRSRNHRRAEGRQSPDEEEQQAQVDALRTPTKKVRLNVLDDEETKVQGNEATHDDPAGRVVTPGTAVPEPSLDEDVGPTETSVVGARRSLFTEPAAKPSPITPSRESLAAPAAKRRLMFGRMVTETYVQENVRKVYKIVKRLTGSLGGNASAGPIYGELTMGSMQKMVNLMKEHTGLCHESRFIDVGSGIGKPSLHVAQDPGVCFSYGIEVEDARWLLGMTCLKGMLDVAASEANNHASGEEKIQHRCVFDKGDVRQVSMFDPFTHVYMFSIGFPPALWIELAKIWNRSSSPYMICYHGPRDIIETYEFDVELIAQKQTSMHGSKEGHTGYIYKRKSGRPFDAEACDPLFKAAFEKAAKDVTDLQADVETEIGRIQGIGPSTRARRSQSRS